MKGISSSGSCSPVGLAGGPPRATSCGPALSCALHPIRIERSAGTSKVGSRLFGGQLDVTGPSVGGVEGDAQFCSNEPVGLPCRTKHACRASFGRLSFHEHMFSSIPDSNLMGSRSYNRDSTGAWSSGQGRWPFKPKNRGFESRRPYRSFAQITRGASAGLRPPSARP